MQFHNFCPMSEVNKRIFLNHYFAENETYKQITWKQTRQIKDKLTFWIIEVCNLQYKLFYNCKFKLF